MPAPLTIGVEEEFFVIDADTRRLRADADALLRWVQQLAGGEGGYSPELRTCMVESRTGVCHTLDQVRTEIRQLRAALVHAGQATGSRIVAAGTFPTTDRHSQGFVAEPRNTFIVDRYAAMAAVHVLCACQVHVGLADRDTAIQVMNRVRPWLPVLAALAASSPFWMGEDTGYASCRSMVWECWPMAGIPPVFSSYQDYQRRVRALIDADTITDAGQIYWDVRPGTRYPTIEFRPADACTSIDDVILQVALCRALVRHYLDELNRGEPAAEVSPELLRAAKWRAARYGLSANLLDPVAAELLPAPALVDRLLALVRPALEDAGDWAETIELVDRVHTDGTSADRQRAVVTGGGSLTDVADLLVRRTVP